MDPRALEKLSKDLESRNNLIDQLNAEINFLRSRLLGGTEEDGDEAEGVVDK